MSGRWERIGDRRARGRGSILLLRGQRRAFGGERAIVSGQSGCQSVLWVENVWQEELYPKNHAGWEDDPEG